MWSWARNHCTYLFAGVWLIFSPAIGYAVESTAGAEGVSERREEISILNERISRVPIDIKQGGQFIEPLCNLIPSMTAQLVAGDSFEEEPPYHVAYKAETDKPFRPWYPDGAVHMAQYSYDTERPFNGRRCQKIVLTTAQCRAGISQDGFSVRQGGQYRLRLHMRSEGNVTVYTSLHGGGRMITGWMNLGAAPAGWTSGDVILEPSATCDNATLTIEGEGPGTLWLDRVYLIGTDAVLGIWRPDVVEALKAMNPGIVRWGGSTTEGYEWEHCIGPWDERAPFTTVWGGLEPNFVGMEEFVQLCGYIGAEPLLCLRWSGKKPEDVGAQVEYFNGGAETNWGAVRAKNGHRAPYRVKYWQVGNEVGGTEYDTSVRVFAEAMKKVDSSIKILSAFVTDQTLAQGGDYLDYLCPHHYGCEDLVGKDREFQRIRDQIARDEHGRNVRVAVTEWNTTAGDWNLGRGTLQTLSNALACARYQNLMHRNADLVEIAIRSNLVDSFGSGVIQTGQGWMYLAPTYYAQWLYQRAAGSYALRVKRQSTKTWQEQEPDISATLSTNGKMLRIFAVNATDMPLAVNVRLEGFSSRVAKGSMTVLKDRDAAGTGEVMNMRDDPARVVPHAAAFEPHGIPFGVTFAPFTLTVLKISLSQ